MAALIVRKVTRSNSSRRNSVVGTASGEPGRGETSRRCVLNGVETGRGSTNRMSVPIPLIALVSP